MGFLGVSCSARALQRLSSRRAWWERDGRIVARSVGVDYHWLSEVVSPETSLAEILAGHMRAGEPIPVPITLAIVRQICDALDNVHNLRNPAGQPLWIVHGDVSPAHIFISDGALARLVPRTTAHGTCAYLAPEYVTTGMLDARADLFALGVVAYEMLANRPLFAANDDRETLQRVCALSIPPPSTFNPQVPPDVDGIVMTALSRDPAYRWPNAAMMRDRLQAIAQRFGFEVRRPGDARPSEPSEPRDDLVPAPPPSDPDLWGDDDNLATRIEPVDPALLDAVPAPVTPEAITVAAAPPTPALASAPAPPAPAAAPAAAPAHAPAPAPAPAHASIAPTSAPTPDPAITFAPKPARPPSNAFDPDLGPEPTQIGAMPLISLGVGDTPLLALVGEPAPRASARTLPPPVVTFLPEPEPPHRTKQIALVAILVVVAIVVVVLVVF